MAGKGEPKTGGRKKGSLNKATKDVKALAQQYGADAIAELGRLAREAESEAARVSAIKELLDRAYGRSPQMVTGDPNQPILHQIGIAWMTEAQAKARGWA